ncbi:hypothetical protein Pmar_PMAR001779, partial [Perkinsus marinus ATCC 50983]
AEKYPPSELNAMSAANMKASASRALLAVTPARTNTGINAIELHVATMTMSTATKTPSGIASGLFTCQITPTRVRPADAAMNVDAMKTFRNGDSRKSHQ